MIIIITVKIIQQGLLLFMPHWCNLSKYVILHHFDKEQGSNGKIQQAMGSECTAPTHTHIHYTHTHITGLMTAGPRVDVTNTLHTSGSRGSWCLEGRRGRGWTADPLQTDRQAADPRQPSVSMPHRQPYQHTCNPSCCSTLGGGGGWIWDSRKTNPTVSRSSPPWKGELDSCESETNTATQRLTASLTGWKRKSLGRANGSLPAMTLCLHTSSSVSCGWAGLNWKPFVKGVMSHHQQTRTSRVIKAAHRGQRHGWGSASQMARGCLMTVLICKYINWISVLLVSYMSVSINEMEMKWKIMTCSRNQYLKKSYYLFLSEPPAAAIWQLHIH